MDMQFAELISLFRYAENALIVERNYFDAKADDPFVGTVARLEAMTSMTQLDARLAELRAQKDELIAAHVRGTFPSPSLDILEKVRAAAETLSNALKKAVTAAAVVLAATDFIGIVGNLGSTVAPAAEG